MLLTKYKGVIINMRLRQTIHFTGKNTLSGSARIPAISALMRRRSGVQGSNRGQPLPMHGSLLPMHGKLPSTAAHLITMCPLLLSACGWKACKIKRWMEQESSRHFSSKTILLFTQVLWRCTLQGLHPFIICIPRLCPELFRLKLAGLRPTL